MRKINYGIIGVAGVIGETHLEAAQALDEINLVAVCDIAVDKGKKRAEECGAIFFEDYKEMLKKARIDAVSICTPHPLHCPMAVDCFDAGVSVLTEKPMAVTVAEADEMIAAAKRTGMTLAVAYQHRTTSHYKKIKEIIDAGEIGDLYYASIVNIAYRNQSYYDSGGWRGTWNGEGGGVLMNQAPHPMDLFQWFTGMPSKVFAWNRTFKHQIEVEDTASALLEYPNGAQGYIHFSTAEAPPKSSIEICGNKGKIEFQRPGGIRMWKFKEDLDHFTKTNKEMFGKPPAQEVEVTLSECEHGHKVILRDFAYAVTEKRSPIVNGEDGRNSVELANAMILSSYRGKVVHLPVDREEYTDLLKELRSGKKR